MKRILKWVFVMVLIIVAIIVALPACVWALHHTIVSATPGALRVNVAPGELGAHVNCFAGTGGFQWMSAYDTPAATTPFGMVRLGPDTASMLVNLPGLNYSGYYYDDDKIIGFSHTRLVGAHAMEGAQFRIFPTVESRVNRDRAKGRYARFSHREEMAFPGYYAVQFSKEDVLAELTATTHVGLHRYTFPKGQAPHLLLDVTSAMGKGRCENGTVRILPESAGGRRLGATFPVNFSSCYGGLDVSFVARFSQPFASYGAWTGEQFAASAKDTAGTDIGVDLASREKPMAK